MDSGPVVLDTSVLLSGKPQPTLEGRHTTPSCVDEVRHRGRDKRALEYLLDTGLAVAAPSQESVARVRDAATGTGDIHRLSAADVDALALCLDLGARLATDDYSMQNVAAVLGIPFEGSAQRGIREVWAWELRCTGCRKRFGARSVLECDVCGSPVRTARMRN